jgi:prepilin-type N-terminal cleavage/methylation domain-containing protein
MIRKFFKNKIKYTSGMTLVELMVVISIFVIVSGLTIFDYGSFNSNTSISNLASDIALTIRKAQSYAIGTHLLGTNANVSYGVHITTSDDFSSNILAGSSKSFILFTDVDNNGFYKYPTSGVCGTPDSNNGCSEILNINTSDKIVGIYVNGVSFTNTNPNSTVDITFRRPNPDARFCYRNSNSSSSSCFTIPISSVGILISNGQGGSNLKTKKIMIYKTGQIGIQ